MALTFVQFPSSSGGPLPNNWSRKARCSSKRQHIWKCSGGKEVRFRGEDGAEVAAYLSVPSEDVTAVTGRGVVVLTDVLGHRNDDTRRFAESLVDAGITIIIPDLFRGQPWSTSRPRHEYEDWRAMHPSDRAMSDARLAAAELRRLGHSVGILGFCFGGGRGMEEMTLGSRGINPDAAVIFYPTRFDAYSAGRQITCPLMLVFGEKDQEIPLSLVKELQNGLDENEKSESCELLMYEGAGHGFAHHPVSDQDEDDAEILQFQTAEWFNKHLPSAG